MEMMLVNLNYLSVYTFVRHKVTNIFFIGNPIASYFFELRLTIVG